MQRRVVSQQLVRLAAPDGRLAGFSERARTSAVILPCYQWTNSSTQKTDAENPLANVWRLDNGRYLWRAALTRAMSHLWSRGYTDWTGRTGGPVPGFLGLSSLKTPALVLKMLKDIGEHVSAQHVTAAFGRISHITPRPCDELLDDVAEIGVRTIGSAKEEDVVGIFEACAKLRYYNRRLLDGLARRALNWNMAGLFTTEEIANLVCAISVLSLFLKSGPGAQWLKRNGTVEDQQRLVGSGARSLIPGPKPVMIGFLSVLCDEMTLFRRGDAQLEVHLPRVLSFLSTLGYHDQRLINRVLEIVSSDAKVARLDNGQLTNALCGFEKMGVANETVLRYLGKEVTKETRLSSFHKTQLFVVLVSLSKLASRQISMGDFCKAAVREGVRPSRMASYIPRDYIVLLGIMVQNRITDDSRIKALLVEELFDRGVVLSFPSYDISMVLDWVSKLGLSETYVASKLVEVLTLDDTACRPTSGALISVASMLSGLEHLETDARNALELLSQKICVCNNLAELGDWELSKLIRVLYRSKKRSIPFAGREEFEAVLTEITKPQRLATLDPADFSVFMSVLGLEQSSALDPAIKMILQKVCEPAHLKNCSQRQLTNVVHNFGRLRHTRDFTTTDEASLLNLFNEILLQRRLTTLSGRNIAAILHGLARIGHPAYRVVRALCKRLLDGRKAATLQQSDLSNVFTAFCILKLKDKALVQALLNMVVLKGLHTFHVHGLTGILYSLAHMGYKDSGIWREMLRELTTGKRLGTFQGQGFSDVVKSMRIIGFKDPSVLDLLIGELTKPGRVETFNLDHLYWIRRELKRLRGENDSAVRQLSLVWEERKRLAG